jgi:hypothetical protein
MRDSCQMAPRISSSSGWSASHARAAAITEEIWFREEAWDT